MLSPSELEREANIARNKALLQQLELKQAVESLPSTSKVKVEKKAKPIQPRTREKRKREPEVEAPRRQSARLRRGQIDPNESPRKRVKREVRCYHALVWVAIDEACRERRKSSVKRKKKPVWRPKRHAGNPKDRVTTSST